jgi:hypothetical protein
VLEREVRSPTASGLAMRTSPSMAFSLPWKASKLRCYATPGRE